MRDVDIRCWSCRKKWKGPIGEHLEPARRQDWYWALCEECREKRAVSKGVPAGEPDVGPPPTADEEFPYA